MVVCFGEILWDVLPSVIKPGGAPMNVAYHLSKVGIDNRLISRIGDDEKGDDLIRLMKDWKLSTEFCQVDSVLPTSEVHAIISDDNEVKYDIRYLAAWDNIAFLDEFESIINTADAFVYGTLSSRDTVSRKTLFKLLEMSKFNVLDINLRAPHYTPKLIAQLLEKTDLLKLNSAELDLVTSWFHDDCKTEADRVDFIQSEYKIAEIIVTKGGNGASYYGNGAALYCPAYKVKVADTVGAGDAFLSGFLAQKLNHQSGENAMDFASVLGAYVTMHYGACPDYTLAELENFKMINDKVLTKSLAI